MMFGKFVKGSVYCGLLPPFNIFFSEVQIYPIKLWAFTKSLLMLEDTTEDHLVQPPCSKQDQLEKVVQDHVRF